MARGLKFRIKEVEELCYQCIENEGADQLRGYRKADLHLCLSICEKPVFSLNEAHIIIFTLFNESVVSKSVLCLK